MGTSLTLPWLELRALTAGGLGSIPGWETEILKASRCGQKIKKSQTKWDPRWPLGRLVRQCPALTLEGTFLYSFVRNSFVTEPTSGWTRLVVVVNLATLVLGRRRLLGVQEYVLSRLPASSLAEHPLEACHTWRECQVEPRRLEGQLVIFPPLFCKFQDAGPTQPVCCYQNNKTSCWQSTNTTSGPSTWSAWRCR